MAMASLALALPCTPTSLRSRIPGSAGLRCKCGAGSLPSLKSQRSQSVNRRLTVKSSYTTDEEAIDIVADVQTEKFLVLGGNGFVGSAICRAARAKGVDITSLSRSGRPTYTDAWVDGVEWVKGDVFTADWDALLPGVVTVISCLGGFGTNEQMERIGGDANVLAVEAAAEAGVERFVFVSVHEYNLPPFLLNNGYFKGKRRAEAMVLEKFPKSGVVLRPGFIYGSRRVSAAGSSFDVPLQALGAPLERLLEGAPQPLLRGLGALPASDLLLLPPVGVEAVAAAAVRAAAADSDLVGVLDVKRIKEVAASQGVR